MRMHRQYCTCLLQSKSWLGWANLTAKTTANTTAHASAVTTASSPPASLTFTSIDSVVAYLDPTDAGKCLVTLVIAPETLGTLTGFAARKAPSALPPRPPSPKDSMTLSAGCSIWLRLNPEGAAIIACSKIGPQTVIDTCLDVNRMFQA